MSDLAHEVSGPASSEPSGIALWQASPASSDRGKLRVFISYSRDDLKFADQLDAALRAYGFECLIDRHGISGGEDWKRRLGNLIGEADTTVFVLSPSSARSKICDWEVEESARLNKRILPIVCRPLEGVSQPPRLGERNYIFFYEEPKLPGSGFGAGLANLITALNTDFDWLRDHTRYLQRAFEWDRGGRLADRLLSGNDILVAKGWAARRPKGAPEPTALHIAFIRASEEEAEARLSERRKQLEAVAAAQAEREKALHQAEEAQRKWATMAKVRNVAFLIVTILAVLAGYLYWNAEEQRTVAETQTKLAEAQREQAETQTKLAQAQKKQADDILERATSIIARSQAQMDAQTKRQAFALFRAGAVHGDSSSMINLCRAYANGLGVAQDYGKAREWCEKAAAKDNAGAMTYLGWLYTSGLGVAQDYGKARDWFEKAAAKDDAKAMTLLGKAYASGRGVAQDYGKAREWCEKAAAKDDAEAMTYLGWLYDSGLGVAQDYAKAREWFEKAAAKDDANAKIALEALPIREAFTTRRYAEALRLEEEIAAKLEAEEAKRDGKPSEQMLDKLNKVVWYALFAKEFTKALTVADRARVLFPSNLDIEINRAHALMFLGHDEEAKVLYLAHKGEVFKSDNQLWEQAIAEDFAQLRKAGLTHPMMPDVEKELSISPD
jgi:TPR repeat protein